MFESEGKGTNGCKMKMHEPYSNVSMNIDKERKILDRVVSHQLIILENPPESPIEEIKVSQ